MKAQNCGLLSARDVVKAIKWVVYRSWAETLYGLFTGTNFPAVLPAYLFRVEV
jgi:hypothetical protein